MNKELKDRAWACLPREFKEKVKKKYARCVEIDEDDNPNLPAYAVKSAISRRGLLEKLFGEHNLTSDAEVEELLTVPRKKVEEKWQRAYEQEAQYSRAQDSPVARLELYYNRGILSILDTLFGSKCLPDELNEDNFAKPEPEFKHKIGDNVRIVNDIFHNNKHKGDITKIVYVDESNPNTPYKVDIYDEEFGGGLWCRESDLEPYTEPKDEVIKMKPIKSQVSVYLATKEEDEEFRKLLYENGFMWSSGAALISLSNWNSANEASQIYFVFPNKTVTYLGKRTVETLTFTEFKKRYFGEDVNLSQETVNCDKQFDNILKDGFHDHNRLHIAAQIVASMIGSDDWTTWRGGSNKEIWHNMAKSSLEIADALIAEAEKGGGNA